jgi:hypothetical protein
MKRVIAGVLICSLLGVTQFACAKGHEKNNSVKNETVSRSSGTQPAGASFSIYVSPDKGTLEATLLALTNASATTVILNAGIYWQTNTLKLSARHSGLTLRAREQGKVVINTGVRIKKSDWQRVTDETVLKRLSPAVRNRLFSLDLDRAGINHKGPYPETFGDFGGLCQLVVNHAWMPLSRFPNRGYLKVDQVLDKGDIKGGKGSRGGVIKITTPHINTWSVDDGLWFQGYWVVPWTRTAIKMASLDIQKKTATFAVGVSRGIGSKYTKPPALGNGMEEFCVINALEELDMSGEWCVRFNERRLYFLSPTPEAPEDALIADQMAPMLSIAGATNVVIEGLSFTGNLGDGIVVEQSEQVQIKGCTFERMCGTAVSMKDARKHRIQSCDFSDIGKSGVALSGGDRKKLISSECVIDNSRFWRIGHHQNTYAPPIDCKSGVGYVVTHNFFHDLPHAAVLYFNNNNSLFEYNEVARAALDSGDVGAFYACLDRTSRGNILRYNFVYDSPQINGFYVDDGDSGDTIVNNVCYNTACGPFVGGGHDNIITGNLSIACITAGFHIDTRGLARGYKDHPGMSKKLEEYQVQQPPWLLRYPELARMNPAHWGYPTGNVLTNNLSVACKVPFRKSGKTEDFKYSSITASLMIQTLMAAGFENPAVLNFRPKAGAHILDVWPAIREIPFAKIGLYRDKWRPTLPDRLALRKEAERLKQQKDAFDSAVDLKASGN